MNKLLNIVDSSTVRQCPAGVTAEDSVLLLRGAAGSCGAARRKYKHVQATQYALSMAVLFNSVPRVS